MSSVDVSNPTSPTEVGYYDTQGLASDVAVSGTYAYVAAYGNGLRIIDVSNPAAPDEVDFYDTLGSANGVAVMGSYAYVADRYGGLDLVWTMLGEVHQLYLPLALRNN